MDRPRPSRRIPHPGALVALPLVAALLRPGPAPAAPSAAEPESTAAAFADRLAAALVSGPAAQDRLWDPAVRDSSRRELDLRTAAMFRWDDAKVVVEHAWADDAGGIVVETTTKGDVAWEPRAWGVASALWTLQADEDHERFRVDRRDAFRLVRGADGGWGLVERIRLRPVELAALDVRVHVFPGQDALLADVEWIVRSEVDRLEAMRFLLDRRAVIYRCDVDGEPAEVVRGGELGALGLDGFSPELESSLRFPRPLARGVEARIVIRLRSPLVHLESGGVVTTLPLDDGPFRVRAWLPVLDPAHAAGGPVERVVMERGFEVRWPAAEFEENAFAPAADVWQVRRTNDDRLEEVGAHLAWNRPVPDPQRDLDFVLAVPGTVIGDLDWEARIPPSLPRPEFPPDRRAPAEPRLFRWASLAEPRAGARLDPHPRARRSLVDPLLEAAGMSTRDLSSELSDLLPMDLDFLDEVFDADRDASDGAAAQGEQ